MDDERTYPDDYVEFEREELPTGHKLSWFIPLGTGGNGKYLCLTVTKDGLETREKELWDGSIMKDETLEYSFDDFKSGIINEWIGSSFGAITGAQIRAVIISQFRVVIPKVQHSTEEPAVKSAVVDRSKRKFNWKVGLLILFGIFIILFPGSRLVDSILRNFCLEEVVTTGEVLGSGISTREIYSRNTHYQGSESYVRFQFEENNQLREGRAVFVEYDSLVASADGRDWWLNTYPENMEVDVYYFKNQPDTAVLQRESLYPGIGSMLLDSLFVLFGVVCLIVAWRIVTGKV